MIDSTLPSIDSSILMDVRSACNVSEEDNGFDGQLIPLINTYLMLAHHQLGIGPNGFNIYGTDETWADWLGDGVEKLSGVRTWLGYNVLLRFDPPDNGTVQKSYQDMIDKLEWMLTSKSHLEGHDTTLYPSEYVEED